MAEFNIDYEKTITNLRTQFLFKLMITASAIAFFFSLYFTFILKVYYIGLVELLFSISFLVIRYFLKKGKITYIQTIHLWNTSVFLLLTITSYAAGGLRAPGIFWYPAIVFSTSVLLDIKSTKKWLLVCLTIVIIFLLLHINGHQFINFQEESKRPISHIVNVIMIFVYVYAFSSLGIKLRKEIENAYHHILKDLYNENRVESIAQIAGGVAHEINNPLAISSGNIQLLEKYLKKNNALDSEVVKFINNLNQANKRASDIVLNLKKFNKDENTQSKNFDICTSVRDSLQFLKGTILKEDISIEVNYPQNKIFVTGAPNKFQQVLLNIFTNSRDALDGIRNKKIIVLFIPKNDFVELKIIDNGHGIPKEIMENIFDPFFTTKPQGKGTGLGLGITRSIIQEMKGIIDYSSNNTNGTEVSITLPLAKD